MNLPMTRMLILVLVGAGLTPAYALLCPGNFNHIAIGDTLAEVQAKCGQPTQKTSKLLPPPTPQEWTYFIPQTVSNGMSTAQQGTLKATITFDAAGKAINISVNGIGVGGSTICGNPINLGDSLDSVKASCGKPSFINQQSSETNNSGQKKDEETTLIYGTTSPVSFTFKNGILTTGP